MDKSPVVSSTLQMYTERRLLQVFVMEQSSQLQVELYVLNPMFPKDLSLNRCIDSCNDEYEAVGQLRHRNDTR